MGDSRHVRLVRRIAAQMGATGRLDVGGLLSVNGGLGPNNVL